MEENSEKERLIKICEKWNQAAITKQKPGIVKKIFAIIDIIQGIESKQQRDIAEEFLKSIHQTKEVKEVRNYVKQDREEANGELQLF